MGGLGAREEYRSYGVDGEQRLVELGYGGGVVPVGIGQGGGVGELHQDTAELLVRSIEGGGGGSTVRSSLPGFERSGGNVLERGSEEKAKELSD